jgi:hypothetical protein
MIIQKNVSIDFNYAIPIGLLVYFCLDFCKYFMPLLHYNGSQR